MSVVASPKTFTFPVDPAELFAERSGQLIGWGIPAATVAGARARVRDMWSDDPSGWVPVWAAQAERAEREGKWLLAALLWGAARFPCLATDSRRAAYERQLAAYELASSGFATRFQRLSLEDSVGPVHIFRRRRAAGRHLLVLSGGVDTWKIELHRMAEMIARATGMVVAALDMPGTGESPVPLTPAADGELATAAAELAERFDAPRTGFFGISFGGHWAAKLALTGRVDAAVDLGGPVGAGDRRLDVARLPYGMTGILAHAFGLGGLPTSEQAAELVDGFSLRRQGVLDAAGGAPLLVVNGERDQFIPLVDTTAFASRPNATVWVVRDATHCAAERIRRVVPAAIGWLNARLHDDALVHKALAGLLAAPLRPLLAAAPA